MFVWAETAYLHSLKTIAITFELNKQYTKKYNCVTLSIL